MSVMSVLFEKVPHILAAIRIFHIIAAVSSRFTKAQLLSMLCSCIIMLSRPYDIECSLLTGGIENGVLPSGIVALVHG